MFGRVPKEKLPIDEECTFHPASPYAISKVGTDLVGRFYAEAYGMKIVTFKSPIKFKQKDGERLLLMIEQVVSRESIWEVVKAKDALEAYARGDYSVMPTVLRVANQVDAPPGAPQIFRKN